MKSKFFKDTYTQVLFNISFDKQKNQTLRFFISVICLLLIVIMLQQKAIAQSLGINTSGAIPDSSAMLDIISPSKGLLIPRVSLTSTTDTITITNPATSLLVYNTNDTMTGGTGLGYYYYDGSLWVNFVSGSSSLNYIQNQVSSDQAAGLRMTGNGLFNGGQLTIGTATPSSGYLLTMNTSSGIGKGLNLTLSGGSGTGINVSSSNAAYNGILVTNSSSSVSTNFYGFASVLSSTNIVSGYSGYRTSSGLSYGIYGINGTSALYATNASTWAAFLRGRTVISSETSPTSGLGTDLEIRNTTTGAGNPATVSMRQGTSNTANASVLANLNFGDNHQTGAQAQIQITRGAAGGASDLPTDMIFSTTPDASATLTERMRILNSGNVGIGTSVPQTKLHLQNLTEGVNELLRLSSANTYNVGSKIVWAAGNNSGIVNSIENLITNDATTSGHLLFKTYTSAGGLTEKMRVMGNGNVGIGTTSPSAKLHTLSTTEQLRLGYDASNYFSTTVGSTGAVTFDATGSGSAFTFSDAVTLPTGSIGVTQSLNDSTTKLATTAFVDRAVAGASGGSGWGLTGTSGTVDGTDFIGTTDNIPFNIKVNNQKSGRLDSTNANSFWGFKAGNDNSSGTNLSATGYKALSKNTSGSYNTANGSLALNSNTTGSYNTADGYQAINSNTTGSYNTSSGYQSMYANTTGGTNTVSGYQAMYSNTMAGRNTVVGYRALYTQSYNSGSPWDSDNIAIGYEALYSNQPTAAAYGSGNLNTAVGNYSLKANTVGYENTAFGCYALNNNTIGYDNVAVGYGALLNYGNAGRSIGVGYMALAGSGTVSNNTGQDNIAIGHRAMLASTSGGNNQAIGQISLYANTTGYGNQALGYATLYTNTTGYFNTAFGHTALYTNLSGLHNIAIGYQSLLLNSTGNYNVGIGSSALALTTASANTSFGYQAGLSNTSGSNNTYIGYSANSSASNLTNSTAIGSNASVNATDKVRIGDANVTVIEGQVAFTSVSDGRFKKNINEADIKGLPFIMRLRPVAYNIDTRQFEEFLVKNMPDSIKVKHFKDKDFTASTAIRHSGFVAQEVELAAQQTNYDFNGVHKPQNADDNYGLAYSEFVVPLVKAMQEQQKIIEDLKLEINKLKAEVSKIPK